MNPLTVYKKLRKKFGPQHWWPVSQVSGVRGQMFEVCVGAILTQAAAWTNVEKAIVNLHRARLMDPERIAKASIAKLKSAIHPAGYFNQKAKKLKAFVRFLDAHGGFEKLNKMKVPELRETLLAVWGIGPETADSIILYAFLKPIFVIDTYTKRLLASFDIRFKTYDEHRLFFENRLPRNVKMWNEYHALIVAWGKNKKADSIGSTQTEQLSLRRVQRQ